MPTTAFIREKIIRTIQETGPITRRKLIRKFGASYREQADYQIGLLLSDGVFITTGIGKRGSPKMIQASPIFCKTTCPMCLRESTL